MISLCAMQCLFLSNSMLKCLQKVSKCTLLISICVKNWKQWVAPSEHPAKKVPLKWSYHKISFTDSKVVIIHRCHRTENGQWKIEIPPKILYVVGTFLKFCSKGSENWRRLLWSQGGECSLSKYKKLYIHETGITKLKKWLQGEAGDLSVSYIIFPIYLDREIEKSQGILSTHVCGNHGSK